MLKINHISGMNSMRVKDFSYSQATGQTHTLLCPSVKFLDELQAILQKKIALVQGSITLEGKNILSNSMRESVQVIGSGEMLFEDLTVIENVFSDLSLFWARRRKNCEKFQEILAQTDYQVDGNLLVKELSPEQRKIVEILHCYHRKPRLLVVRELSSIVSYGTFIRFMKVLDMLNSSGTTVLYLTSQWEETLKVSKDITLVMNGKVHSEYSMDEVRKDPSTLCSIAMGAKHFQEKYEEKKNEYNLFRTLSSGVSKISTGYNIRHTMQMFTNYLMQALNADSAATYLIEPGSYKLLEQAAHTNGHECPTLKAEMIKSILQKNELAYLSQNDFSFNQYFTKKTTNQTVICYPMSVNEAFLLVVQVGYEGHYTYTNRDTVIIEWVAQEMIVFIENSRLMGKSVLLRESHHRIKNNLQIIISLMEMEKEKCFPQISEKGVQQEIEDAFDSAIGRIKCIAQVHDLLARESSQSSFMDMYMIVRAVSTFYQPGVVVNLQFESIYVPYSKAVNVALVVNEIISNSIKHNRHLDGELRVDIKTVLDQKSQTIHLTCRDNGVGYPCEEGEEFVSDSEGLGIVILGSIINMEFEGEYHCYNDHGAVVDIVIPQKALLPIEKRELDGVS